MADEPKTNEPARESGGPPLPPQQRFIFKVLDRFGLPTLLVIGMAFYIWYRDGQHDKERREDRQTQTAALQGLTQAVRDQQEILGNIKLLLTIQVKQAQLEGVDPNELEKKQERVTELQRRVPSMTLPEPRKQ